MAVEIIVEDGSVVPGANSYVSVAELVTYAEERGITLPENPESLLIKAMDYLETLDEKYIGEPVDAFQTLSWPRQRHSIIMDIPSQLRKAQLVLATTAITVPLTPVMKGGQEFATRKTVGPITIEYKEATTGLSGASVRPRIPQVDSLLKTLLASNAAGQLRVVRG